jgi:hypothetical protein
MLRKPGKPGCSGSGSVVISRSAGRREAMWTGHPSLTLPVEGRGPEKSEPAFEGAVEDGGEKGVEFGGGLLGATASLVHRACFI